MKIEAQYLVDGIHIKDKDGRVVFLRGCNLGGDCKIPFSPAGNPLSYDVSFTGRPFPEMDADGHFARLAGWGFTFLRLVITWEAVEHAGPGLYDEEYLSYLRAILKKAENHGIFVFIDPHQDVWSRWTGGDGAPGWTLEAAGFDLVKIPVSGAAFTEESQGSSYKQMTWGLNYLHYAAATMNTLFFGANTFAPGRLVDGVPIQEYLQGHFIDAMQHTARRLKDCKAIVGFGTLNEPHAGFIGLRHISGHYPINSPAGAVPTAFQAMAAASGFPQMIRRFALAGVVTKPGKQCLNETGVSLFRDGYECPWKQAGVWAVENGKPVIKKGDYFARLGDGPDRQSADFCEFFLKPFQKRFMETVSKKHDQYIFFVEGIPMAGRVSWTHWDRIRSDGTPFSMVEAMHWYDGLTLLFKKWRPWLTMESETRSPVVGPRSVRKSIKRQVSILSEKPRQEGIPALLGEFGVPFDLDGGRSFKTGDYTAQESALGAYYDGVDANLLHSTIWNYAATNTHTQGDGWNTEDLSIYNAESGGGRAVRGFSRPYAMAVAGMPKLMHFDRKKRLFTFEWEAAAGITELFVPGHWYPEGWQSGFSGGNAILEEKPEAQRLLVQTSEAGIVRITVSPQTDRKE